jgi:hypothetical protein
MPSNFKGGNSRKKLPQKYLTSVTRKFLDRQTFYNEEGY